VLATRVIGPATIPHSVASFVTVESLGCGCSSIFCTAGSNTVPASSLVGIQKACVLIEKARPALIGPVPGHITSV
jgi:hypothetical protein